MEALRAAAVFAAVTALSAVGAPRLWLGFLAGAMLANPFFVAFPVALAASLLGNYALFAACRSGRARRLVGRIVKNRKMPAAIGPAYVGIPGVVLVRQMPVPGVVSTLFLAGAHVTGREFVLGSLIGFAPSTLIVVLAGSAAHFLPRGASAWAAVAMAAGSLLAWLAQRFRLGRKARRR